MPNSIYHPQNLTLAISLLALALAIAALALAWRAAARGRAILSLQGEYIPYSGMGVGFKLEITNSGRRPVTIEDVRLIDNRGKAHAYQDLTTRPIHFAFSLPCTLEAGEKVSLTFPIWHLPSASRDPRDYRRILVTDTSGNRWSLSLAGLTRGIGEGEV